MRLREVWRPRAVWIYGEVIGRRARRAGSDTKGEQRGEAAEAVNARDDETLRRGAYRYEGETRAGGIRWGDVDKWSPQVKRKGPLLVW